MSRATRAFAVLVGLTLTGELPAEPSYAQTPTAAVVGVVADSENRPLGDVRVLATDLATGLVYRTSTSVGGRYWLRGLPPGCYDLTAERIGLRTTIVREVRLPVGKTVTLDLVLPPSAVELSALTVDVRPPPIMTTRSEVSSVLDRERIGRLPEESRQFIELARIVPGATRGRESTGGPPQFGTTGSAVGALSRQSLAVLVDGADFTEGLFGDLGGSLPLLAIQEFEVAQSQYSAELGRGASGVVNVATRRGGNQLRSEGFVLYRDRALTARGPFQREKPDFERWHWGAAVGGPLVRNRTHVFAAFERRVQNDVSTVHTGGAFPEYEGTFSTPFVDNLVFVRLDHRIGEAHDLTVRYSGEFGEKLLGVGGIHALENGHNDLLDFHSGVLTYRWSPSTSWLAQTTLHYMSHDRKRLRNADPGPTLVYPDLVAGPNPAEEFSSSSRIELRSDVSGIGEGFGGIHRFRFGAHVSALRNRTGSSFFENGLFVFPSNAATLPVAGQASFRDPAIRLDATNLQLAFYVHDQWMPTDALTLDLGVRYDVETDGSNQDFVSPFAGRLPFVRSEERPVDKNNVAPRIGITWTPGREGRTVVRAGFGIFYDASVAGPLLALERSSGVPLLQFRDPGAADLDALMIDPDTVPPVVWAVGDYETPFTRQLSLGIEHAFQDDFVVRIDGLYVQGRNLLLQRNLNPLEDGALRFPDFARATQLASEGRAEAKMLLVGVRKEFERGWVDFGYTLADRRNTNDNWGRPFVPQTDLDRLDPDAEMGPAAWDERHRVVATGALKMPGDLALVAKAVYASERPFTAVTGTDDNGDFDRENDRPPGEGRNARRGPDFFQADLSLMWEGIRHGSIRAGLVVNVYNAFNRANGIPASVQNNLQSPRFGEATAAFASRQVEVGMRISGR